MPSLCVFHPISLWGGGGGLPRGLRHNLLMQFPSLGSSKMEFSKTYFFDTLTIQNDQISCIKHVLAPLYVFFTLLGCGGGGFPRGMGHNLLMQFSRLGSSSMVIPLPSSRCLAEGNRIYHEKAILRHCRPFKTIHLLGLGLNTSIPVGNARISPHALRSLAHLSFL